MRRGTRGSRPPSGTAPRIAAETKFSSSGTQIHFKPSLLRVLDKDWNFEPENQILISQGEITVDHLYLLHEGQMLGLDGKISENPEEVLDLVFRDVGIDLLNTITPQQFGTELAHPQVHWLSFGGLRHARASAR